MNCVVFDGRISFTVDALQLLWSLEAKGVQVLVDGGGELKAGPAERLTPADIAAIRESRHELRRIVAFCNSAWVM